MSNIILKGENYEITQTLAQFGSTSYPIANIGSISIKEIPEVGSAGCAWITIVFGALILISSTSRSESAVPIVVAFIFLIGGIAMFQIPPKPASYILMLKTSSGDQKALTSNDASQVKQIKQAIESAIAG